MATILIVEDEPKIAELLADYLQQSGYETHCIDHGDQVLPFMETFGTDYRNGLDAVLLDVMLPGCCGIDLCRAIRAKSDIPVLMITARVDEIDRIIGLEIGADDYICKPFSPREVVARVKAILRRLERRSEKPQSLSLDDERYLATLKGEALTLTAVEYHLLNKLAGEPGRIFSRQQLIDSMYNDGRVVSDRTVDSHIKKLRKKLALAAPEDDIVRSVYGVGYKLELPR